MAFDGYKVEGGRYACFNGRAGEVKNLPKNPWLKKACGSCVFSRRKRGENGLEQGDRMCFGRTQSAIRYINTTYGRLYDDQGTIIEAMLHAGELPGLVETKDGVSNGRIVCGNGIFTGRIVKS